MMAGNSNTDVDKLITFGQMALEQGWYDQAREYFEQVLALDATNREAMKGLARVNEILSRKAAAAAEPTWVEPVKSPRKVQKTTAGKAMYAIAAIVVVVVVAMMLRAVYTYFAPSSTEPTTKAMLTTTAMPIPVEATSTPKPVEATSTPIPPTSRPPTPTPRPSVGDIVRKALGQGNRGVARVKDVKVMGDGLIVVDWAINNHETEVVIKTRAQMDVVNVAEALCAAGFCQGLAMNGSFPLLDVYGNTSEDIVVVVQLGAETLTRINWEVFRYSDIYVVADELYLHPAFQF